MELVAVSAMIDRDNYLRVCQLDMSFDGTTPPSPAPGSPVATECVRNKRSREIAISPWEREIAQRLNDELRACGIEQMLGAGGSHFGSDTHDVSWQITLYYGTADHPDGHRPRRSRWANGSWPAAQPEVIRALAAVEAAVDHLMNHA